MTEKHYPNVNHALPALLRQVLEEGATIPSRNGATRELMMKQFTLTDITQPYVTTPGRNVSLPAQIAETMWILAGRNDIAWLSHYLPRAADFSDDGRTWRGGYGPRLRSWWIGEEDGDTDEVDQLRHVVDLLKEDPETRRAVFQIYDPAIDTDPGKDVPCNNWFHFLPRGGALHGHVAIRSNDLFWGWSGINHFEWSVLLNVVAQLAGLRPGTLTFSISSLHLYDRHWDRAKKILRQQEEAPLQSWSRGPMLSLPPRISVSDFDELVHRWFQLEGQIRKGGISGALQHQIESFPEPMLRSWLFVLLAWTHDDESFLSHYRGTKLYEAFKNSPKMKKEDPVKLVQQSSTVQIGAADVWADRFQKFLIELHESKDAAYGTSWKRRGEMLGIMANMARKVDRLGVAGGGDTAADTAIDLLVYTIKYHLWLSQKTFGYTPDISEGEAHLRQFRLIVEGLIRDNKTRLHAATTQPLEERATALFAQLEAAVESTEPTPKFELIAQLGAVTLGLAYTLWAQEEWKKGNSTRSWNPEQDDYENDVEELDL